MADLRDEVFTKQPRSEKEKKQMEDDKEIRDRINSLLYPISWREATTTGSVVMTLHDYDQGQLKMDDMTPQKVSPEAYKEAVLNIIYPKDVAEDNQLLSEFSNLNGFIS